MTYLGKPVPIIVLALLFALVACTTDAADADADATGLTPEDRTAIEALFAEWKTHNMARDWEGYAGLFHLDAIRKMPGTQVFQEGREEILEAAVASDPTIDHLEFSVLEIAGIRQLAYAVGTYEVIFVIDGEEVRDEGTVLAVVRPDEDGAWRFYRVLNHSNQ